MPAARHRTERCAAHGVAIGLCEQPGCPGAPQKRMPYGVSRPREPRCSVCKQHRGDAIYRHEYEPNKVPPRFCKDCWDAHVARVKEIEKRKHEHRPPRDYARENARRQQRAQAEQDSDYDG